MSTPGTLYIVDDDPAVRRALGRLLRSAGYVTKSFRSADDFLVASSEQMAGCLILDLAMPGMSGLELQQSLRKAGCWRPIIFLSGKADISKSVRAMKSGAVNFLTKPVDARELFASVEEALLLDASERAARTRRHGVTTRIATLTPRERQVLVHVVAGMINKQIAARLGIAEKTIKVHRSRVMRKMQAASVVQLVKLASLAGIHAASQPWPKVSPNIVPAQSAADTPPHA